MNEMLPLIAEMVFADLLEPLGKLGGGQRVRQLQGSFRDVGGSAAQLAVVDERVGHRHDVGAHAVLGPQRYQGLQTSDPLSAQQTPIKNLLFGRLSH